MEHHTLNTISNQMAIREEDFQNLIEQTGAIRARLNQRYANFCANNQLNSAEIEFALEKFNEVDELITEQRDFIAQNLQSFLLGELEDVEEYTWNQRSNDFLQRLVSRTCFQRPEPVNVVFDEEEIICPLIQCLYDQLQRQINDYMESDLFDITVDQRYNSFIDQIYALDNEIFADNLFTESHMDQRIDLEIQERISLLRQQIASILTPLGMTEAETFLFEKIPNDEPCSVCLEEFKESEKGRKLPCEHTFHAVCINEWLRSSTTCPLCRYSIV